MLSKLSKYNRAIVFLLLFFFSFAAFSKGKAAKPKVIIHEIGEKNTDSWIFNTEINQYKESTYLNPSITYSTKNNWDISISSQNIPIYGGGTQSFQDDTYFMLSKTFRIDGSKDIIIGSQNGYQFYDQGIGKMHQLYFIDTVHKINEHLTIHGGSYYVNSALSTTTNYTGGLTGFIIKYDDYIIKGDYFGGHSNVSGASVTVGYFPTNWFNPYIGIGVPERDSGNEFYGVIGFSISNQSLK